MKKTLVRRFAALALALLMAALIPMGALAEGGITTPTDLQPVAEAPAAEPVAEETTQPAEPAPEVTEPEATAEPTVEPAPEATTAPVEEIAEPATEPAAEPSEPVCEEPTAEPTSEPVEQQPAETEEPVENTVVEPTAEPTEEPVKETVTTDPDTEEPTESREEIIEQEPAAPAKVTIILRTAGPLYYGDEVTLGVLVENVEGNYTITWQAKVAEDRWEDVEVGMTYKFILTPENASMEYRAVLTVIE